MRPAEAVALAQRLWAALPEHGDDALSVLNGLFGDHLEAARSPLAIPMTFYRGVERSPVPDPPTTTVGPHACVLVHGLMGNERAWAMGTAKGNAVEYGAALSQARDVTPVYVRYNTGRHISENGEELAEGLEALHAAGGLQELTIVAHSMGGLVTRSACHHGLEANHAWVQCLRRVFLLGAPSHGAPLEQLVHVAAFTLESIWNPWTKLIGKVMNLRSSGIKDLRHGFALAEDWRNRDPDTLALRKPRPTRVPPDVRWYVAAGALGERDGALAWLVGDGLVHSASARGHGLGTPAPGVLPEAQLRVFDRTSHIGLMNDPRVLEQLIAWWT